MKNPIKDSFEEDIYDRKLKTDELSFGENPISIVSSRKARELTEKNLKRLSQITKKQFTI